MNSQNLTLIVKYLLIRIISDLFKNQDHYKTLVYELLLANEVQVKQDLQKALTCRSQTPRFSEQNEKKEKMLLKAPESSFSSLSDPLTS